MKAIPLILSVSCYFQVHRALTITCLLLTITGFVLVFVHAEGWSDVRLLNVVIKCYFIILQSQQTLGVKI